MPDTFNTLLFVTACLLALVGLGIILLRFLWVERSASKPSSPSVISGEPPQSQYSESALIVMTPRERDVALLAARGLSNRQIAGDLGMSIHTVNNHLKRIYAKLEISSRTELAWRLQYMDMSTRDEIQHTVD